MAVFLNKMARDYAQASRGKSTDMGSTPVILVVGDVANWHDRHPGLPNDAKFLFAEYNDISESYLKEVKPDIVLSSLMWATFDCLDLAKRLHALHFKGKYRILTRLLPKPELILKEIHGHCPLLEVDFIFTGPEKGTTLN